MANAIMAHRLDSQNDSLREVIDWNLPMEHMDYADFSKLSLEIEIRNKMWENESNKRNLYQQQSSSNSSPILDQNQNVSNDIAHFINENHTSNSSLTSSESHGGKFSMATINQNFTNNGNYQSSQNMAANFSSISLGGSPSRNQHLMQSSNLIQNENLSESGQGYDSRMVYICIFFYIYSGYLIFIHYIRYYLF